MTMRYLEGLSAAAASALAISVGFVMWLSWRSPARSVVIESSELRYPPLFWIIELLVFAGVFYLIVRH